MPFRLRFNSSKFKKGSNSREEQPDAGPFNASSSTNTAQAEQQMYNLNDYDSDEDDKDVPDENLEVAAGVMAGLFSQNEVEYFVMGGFSLKMRGSQRKTNDVDFGVNLTGKSLWEVMTQIPHRLIIPNTKKSSGVVRVFCKTGPTCGDEVDEDRLVGVDLLLPGFGGVPNPKKVASARERLVTEFQGIEVTLWVLNIGYTLRSKLGRFEDSTLRKDFIDIMYLVKHYPQEVAEIADKLDDEQKRTFINFEYFSEVDEEERLYIARMLGLVS